MSPPPEVGSVLQILGDVEMVVAVVAEMATKSSRMEVFRVERMDGIHTTTCHLMDNQFQEA
jgi:hypothetical protein